MKKLFRISQTKQKKIKAKKRGFLTVKLDKTKNGYGLGLIDGMVSFFL